MATRNKYLVAVYGTLRKGQCANGMMGDDFVCHAVTHDNYKMWDVGFPYIQYDDDGHPVAVDVYRVNADRLAALDSYQGVPSNYMRSKTLVRPVGGGESLYCFIYYAVDPHGVEVEPTQDGVLDWVRS